MISQVDCALSAALLVTWEGTLCRTLGERLGWVCRLLPGAAKVQLPPPAQASNSGRTEEPAGSGSGAEVL